MKTSLATIIAATLAISLALPSFAQTQIPAPRGWTTQTKTGGAVTFTPPDLKTGEVYSVAVYDSAPLDGQTLEAYLRAFAGPVEKTAGKLGAPLQTQTRELTTAVGLGTYVGPGGAALPVMFIATALDGKNIHVARILFSQSALLSRYANRQGEILASMKRRAVAEAGRNIVEVPESVLETMKPGGAIVPGLYVGNQYREEELKERLRIHLYANGEYRIASGADESSGDADTYSYNRNTGQLNLSWTRSLANHTFGNDVDFCYYGLDSAGKPVILAEKYRTTRTRLTYAGPNKLPAPSLLKARDSARAAAIEAEKNRFKWVTAPGKGVANAQIAAILLDAEYDGTKGYGAESVYLLLKDGSVYADLPVAPDTLDVVKSKQKEPNKWGKWQLAKGGYKVSWSGAPYQDLPGEKATPAPAQLKLAGRWISWRSNYDGISGSYSEWGVALDAKGRFKKDGSGTSFNSMGNGSGSVTRYDDEGSSTSVAVPGAAMAATTKRNPNGDREGTYSLSGYVLTLRYDNGRVARLPFFFTDAQRTGLWFEGGKMSKSG